MDIETLLNGAEDEGQVAAYQYFRLLKDRAILFNDECADDIIEKVGMPLLEFEQDDSNAPVDLYINSQGGEVFSSLFLCNIIDNYKKPLRIHILGYALSMAGVLACAGSKNPNVTKDCYPFSIGMLHAGSITVSGTSGQSKSFMKFNDRIEDKTKTYILSNTSISETDYDNKNDEDWWLTAEEMLELGIVDKVIGGCVAKKKKNNITLDFSNGEFAEHVSGAGVYLEELNMLFECGYSQSNNLQVDYRNNNKQFTFSCKDLQAIFVSHCHIDHIGRIPLLYKRGCQAPIYVTKGSKFIIKNMWEDSVKINERDSLLLSHQSGKNYPPIYDMADMNNALQHIIEVDMETDYWVNADVKIRFISAGHIKYSSQIELYVNNKKLVYTGDLGNYRIQKHFTEKFTPIEKCDVLIGECTYGDGKRPKANASMRKKDIEKLTTVIQHYCVESHNRILIPCFSLDRTPEMYMVVRQILQDNNWEDIPIIIDSPLAVKQIQIYGLANPELLTSIHDSNTKLISSFTTSKTYQESQERMIILSSSGMLNAGRVLSYLPHILSNSNNCIVFCGYSTEGTLAWQIKEGDKKRIKIGEEWVNNRANIINLYSFSSHMQHDELLHYYSTIQANKIYLVHGQMESKLSFAKELKDALERNNRTTQVICVNKGTKGRL